MQDQSDRRNSIRRWLFCFCRLFGDNEIRDLTVRGRGHNSFALQLGLVRIGAARNDLLRVDIAYARQRLKLIGGSRIDVNKFACGGCGWSCLGNRLGLGADRGKDAKQRSRSEAEHNRSKASKVHFVFPFFQHYESLNSNRYRLRRWVDTVWGRDVTSAV